MNLNEVPSLERPCGIAPPARMAFEVLAASLTEPQICRIIAGIETSSSSSQQARDHRFLGGSQELLRRAAESLADAGPCDDAAGEGQSIDNEVRALSRFISDTGLELKSEDIVATLTANPMRGGKEHRVAFLPEVERVLKVADARMLATESLFDYLADLLLSNHYFEDDIRLAEAYRRPLLLR